MGARVVCFDDHSTGKTANIKEFLKNPKFTFIKGDANQKNDLARAFRGKRIDYVFHYAARVGVIRTAEKPLEVFADLEGIKNILDLSSKNKVKKVMFASSSEVYGEPVELPEREDGPLNIHIPYATVKLAGEQMMRAYYEIYGLPTCSLRFFNVYGPKQDGSAYGFVVGIFVKKTLAGEPLTIFGRGNQTRDFVFVKDNIHASILALLNPKTDGEVLNIGRQKSRTILELAKMVRKVSGRDLKFVFKEKHKGDKVVHRSASVKKLKRLIGYVPRTDLEEGLRKTLEYYKNVI
jgi:UDP-glucose 4-epimerase